MGLTIISDGTLIWTNEKGQWHREKGPALICTSGTIECWFNDRHHRLDGPAVIWSDGLKNYYIHGKEYTKKAYYTKVKKL